MSTHRSAPRIPAWLLPVAAAVAMGLQAGTAIADAARPSDKPVGEITMAVGPVVKTNAQGMPERVTRGSRISPGDRLDTADGGHVHIRFVDGAMVSVRPGSRLWVEDYQFDPQQVSKSLVRFKLEYGVARAISGAAAEGAKERFRLNTPLVAIGVRGTDFVVRSGAANTAAAVNQGAIIMAPLGEGCAVQGLGPCRSADARLLSADMGRMLVEFKPAQQQPEIKPLQATAFATHLDAPPGGHSPQRPPGPGPVLAAADGGDLATVAMMQGSVQAAIDAAPPPIVTPPPPPPPVEPATLQWGRWAEVAASGDTMTQPRAQAVAGRAVTVGNLNYVLYRASEGASRLDPNLGSYQFTLNQSFAQYSLGGQVSPATVQNGTLGINFGQGSFTTSLQVANALTGLVAINGGGSIRIDGVFVDIKQQGLSIAGATSFDGKSAGYFFDKLVNGGTLSGLTLWSRP